MFDIVSSENPGMAPVWAFHASASSPRQWSALAEAAGSHRPFVMPDLPGYPGWRLPYQRSLADRAQAVIARIAAGGQPAHLVGHSMGGAVALKVALIRPDLVASLCLYEAMVPRLLMGAATGAERAALCEVEAVSARLTASVACGDPEGGMAQFVDFWGGPGSWARMDPVRRARLAEMAIDVMTDFAHCGGDPVTMADLRALRVPVRLISGSKSPAVTRRVSERLLAALPDVVHVELAGANHMAPVSNPDRVNRLVLDHIHAVEAAWSQAA